MIRRKDAVQLQQAQQLSGSAGASFDQMMKLQQMQLQQEQLRYLETMRTGKPAGPDAPKVVSSGGHLEAKTIAMQIQELRTFQAEVIKAADEIRPKSNPGEFLNSPFMQGIGEGLGSLIAQGGQEILRTRRERGAANPLRGPTTTPAGVATAAVAAAPPRQQNVEVKPPPEEGPSGFIGTAAEPPPTPASPPPPAAANPGNPGNPGRVEIALSAKDKEYFERTQSMVATLADMVGNQNSRMEKLEQIVAAFVQKPPAPVAVVPPAAVTRTTIPTRGATKAPKGRKK